MTTKTQSPPSQVGRERTGGPPTDAGSMVINKHLQHEAYRFCLLKPKEKTPFEKGWQKNGYKYNDPKLLNHIKKGGNFGVIGGYGDLRILDIDNSELAQKLFDELPKTFTVRTGGGGLHFYYNSTYDNNHVLVNELGEFRAKKYQVVCSGCTHPNGNKYEVINDSEIIWLEKYEIKEILKPYLRGIVDWFDEADKRAREGRFQQSHKRDTSRSGKEYRECIKLISKGLTKNDVFREMLVFKKWAEASPQYRELTYNKALGYVEAKKQQTALEVIITPKLERILKDTKLWEIIDYELDKKIEGEKSARKAIFCTFNMRNVQNLSKATDNLMTNDEGGTGKDHVVSAIYNMLPDSEKMKKERISPKVLAYLNDTKNNPEGWTKKALYLEDVPNTVLNDDAFKVMSSADPNGVTETSIVINNALKNIDIKGKPSIVITVASANPKQELLRRYPICNLTSTTKQTEAVLKKQAIFAQDGISPEYDAEIKRALSCLKRIQVRIPFAQVIAEAFPTGNVIIRTHFPRFLDYIKSSCALYQYQRQQDEEGYYIAIEQDYEFGREVMSSTTSNQLMIPLTKLQRRLLAKFKELKNPSYTFLELEEKMQQIANGRWLRNQLEKLVEHGFLTRGNEKREHSIKPLAVYSYNDLVKLELPSFKELKNSSNNTLTSNNTNNTDSAKQEDKENTPNLRNLHYMHCEYKDKPNIYQAIKTLDHGQGAPMEAVKQAMKCSNKDFEQYLTYAKTNGDIFEIKPGLFKLVNEGTLNVDV